MKIPTRFSAPGLAPTSGKKLRLSAVVLAMLLGVSAIAGAQELTYGDLRVPELPSPVCDEVNVPDGYRLGALAYALGVQVYRWSGTNWAFVGPEATLYADACYESVVGIHYAGPTWEANDGSKVVASRIAGCAPIRGIIPWLRLGATRNEGSGRFARVAQIQRLNTIGGVAPAEPGQAIGEEARVPYTAEYYFYRPKN
jgi:hypothetical protein